MSFFTLPRRLIYYTKIMPAVFDTETHLLHDLPVRAQQCCDARPSIAISHVVGTEQLRTALLASLLFAAPTCVSVSFPGVIFYVLPSWT